MKVLIRVFKENSHNIMMTTFIRIVTIFDNVKVNEIYVY